MGLGEVVTHDALTVTFISSSLIASASKINNLYCKDSNSNTLQENIK